VTADPQPPPGRGGFAVLEVMIAMVLMAIAMLAIQGMGVHALRNLTRAQMQSEYAQSATRHLESVADSVRRSLIACGTRTRPNGARGDSARVVIRGTQDRREIVVSILPAAGPNLLRPDSFHLIRDLYVPGAAAC
jgi:type II secretory pathway component PulJ